MKVCVVWTIASCAVLILALPARAGEADAKTAGETTAQKAAAWLLAQANDDGTFGKSKARGMPGIVGLALYGLAKSPGHPTADKVPALRKAADYLASRQMENGAIAIKEIGLENYNTSVAVVALKVLEDPKYQEVLEKAKQYLLSCQLLENQGYNKDEHTRSYGGFGYGNTRKTDLSNTSFTLDALKAMGFDESSPQFKNALLFVKRCQDNKETNDAPEMRDGDGTGGFVYLPGESEFGTVKSRGGKEIPKPYGNMTYAGIKSLIYCGEKPDSPDLAAAWKWVRENYNVKENPGGSGGQGYFYYIVAFSKAFAASGQKEFKLADGKSVNWAADLIAHLSSLQSGDGSFANTEKRWMEDDPVLSTAYALQALNRALEIFK